MEVDVTEMLELDPTESGGPTSIETERTSTPWSLTPTLALAVPTAVVTLTTPPAGEEGVGTWGRAVSVSRMDQPSRSRTARAADAETVFAFRS